MEHYQFYQCVTKKPSNSVHFLILYLVILGIINQLSTPNFMNNKIAITLFVAIIAGFSFVQKLNISKLDSLFQILETKNKFMSIIAISQNCALLYSKSLGINNTESNKKKVSVLSKYLVGSILKMFTSTLIFRVVKEEKLMLSQTIETFFQLIKTLLKYRLVIC